METPMAAPGTALIIKILQMLELPASSDLPIVCFIPSRTLQTCLTSIQAPSSSQFWLTTLAIPLPSATTASQSQSSITGTRKLGATLRMDLG